VNIHASLLPKYRGAAPIQRAVMAGERVTGVSAQRMVSELDAGDVYLARETEISKRETAGELHDRLAVLGAGLLCETLRQMPQTTPQDHEHATWAPPLSKEEGCIDWSMPVQRIDAIIRGVTPWPGAYTVWQGKRLKLFDCEPLLGEKHPACGPPSFAKEGQGILFPCSDGVLCVREVQAEGGRRMKAAEFLRGLKN